LKAQRGSKIITPIYTNFGDRWEWVDDCRPPTALPTVRSPIHIKYEAVWALGLASTDVKVEKVSSFHGRSNPALSNP